MAADTILSAEYADEATIARVARVMGASSPSQLALNELKSRRDAGETVVAYNIRTRLGTSILVGPPLEDAA